MGYRHIDNLYKNQDILAFRECYALEKIHGTSAHVGVGKEGQLVLFSGGEPHANFVKLFNEEELLAKLKAFSEGMPCTFFGEAYGGKQQGMRDTYGSALKFIVFDVRLGSETEGIWLTVPEAEAAALKVGLEFVPYNKVSTDIVVLDAERDLPSRQAVRNGILEPKIAEGIVVRPIREFKDPYGHRIMAKHKRVEFSERLSKKDTTINPEKHELLIKAKEIAREWVTPMRLEHVLDKMRGNLGREPQIEEMRNILDAMVEDITREAKGEILESEGAMKEIRSMTAGMFKKLLNDKIGSA